MRHLCLFVTRAPDEHTDLERQEGFEPVAEPGHGYRLLVVAGSEFTRRRARRDLARAGFSVRTVENEDAARGELAASRFDAVLQEPEGDLVDLALEALWERPATSGG